MSDVRLDRRAAVAADTFRGRTVALILVIGILGFIGTLVLGAYAPDMRSGRDGGTHALSNAAVGFSGIVRLVEATGRNPLIIRNDHLFGSEDLLVVTPGSGFIDLTAIFRARMVKPTLYVLPKWETTPDRKHRGWVDLAGTRIAADPASLMSPATILQIARRPARSHWLVASSDFAPAIRFAAPPLLQVITGLAPKAMWSGGPTILHPLLTDGAGGIVVAQIGRGPLFVLADPDLMSNAGIKDPRQAAAALAMLDWMNSNGATSIGFDVTANGFGQASNPLKLAFIPPFLAMTLALAAALLLVGWHAIGRFGPIRLRDRAIGLGTAVLVENSAKLMSRARREAMLGRRYAQLVRERAAARFGVSARLKDAALDAYLDTLGDAAGARFSDLARKTEAAGDRDTLVTAAHALHRWQETIR